jgi:ribulose-5-phosphate 4-epimerase/fuculose-1-phosphate aldolase
MDWARSREAAIFALLRPTAKHTTLNAAQVYHAVSITLPREETPMSSQLEIPSLKGKVSPEEWAVRVDLAACYRLVARYGWEDLVFTHISARVPGAHEHFLINPYGLFFDEITASSLVKIDLQGNNVGDSPFPVNQAGFIIHSAIHAARADARCVLHTHTVNGVAVATQRAGLQPISQHSMFVLASLGYHDFEGVALDEGEQPRLVRDLGHAKCLILRNHGLLTVGETVADAFIHMYYLEASCAIQVRAQSGGGELIPVPKDVLEGHYARMATMRKPGEGPGALVWPGLLRRLDRTDPSFRT